jgi:molybdopterin molybdotransferase
MTPFKPKPMLALRDAVEAMLAAARAPSDSEMVPTLAANGRVLAQAQTSSLQVPPADNSNMDGYAVRAADCAGATPSLPVRLPVSQRIAAGHVGTPLLAGTAARIFTGAQLPPGADAVLMQEQCQLDGELVAIGHAPQAGEWVRRAGEDIIAGGQILAAGTRLRSQELGLAASVGLAELPVWRRLRVAVFFTGDELTMPGQPLAPGAIYNSNRFVLRALLENLGCEVEDFGNVPDTLPATRAVLRAAAAGNDLILTSGGVSVGEEDHIKPAVEAEGRLNLWQIAIKPGKPLAFGEVGGACFVGLPGNPVSSLVTFLLCVRPLILRLQGVTEAGALAPRGYTLRADFSWPKGDRRNEFLRVRINAAGGLDLFPNQSSGVLTSTVWGDGLLDNPPGRAIAPGDSVRFLPFSELLH